MLCTLYDLSDAGMVCQMVVRLFMIHVIRLLGLLWYHHTSVVGIAVTQTL